MTSCEIFIKTSMDTNLLRDTVLANHCEWCVKCVKTIVISFSQFADGLAIISKHMKPLFSDDHLVWMPN